MLAKPTNRFFRGRTNFDEDIFWAMVQVLISLTTITFSFTLSFSFKYVSHTHPLTNADTPGVGKGRQVAALFLENWMQGRKKGIWMSASKDLQHDARRDLDDVDAADIPSEALNDMEHGIIHMKAGMAYRHYYPHIKCSHPPTLPFNLPISQTTFSP